MQRHKQLLHIRHVISKRPDAEIYSYHQDVDSLAERVLQLLAQERLDIHQNNCHFVAEILDRYTQNSRT